MAQLTIELEPARLRNLVVLVVAGKDDQRRVVPQLGDSLLCLELDAVNKGIVRWVLAAAEHEVLPDEDTLGVAVVVERLGLEDSASPDANLSKKI